MSDTTPQAAPEVVDSTATTAPATPAPEAQAEPDKLKGESPAEATIRKFKVRVDDEDLEVDEAELLKGYQTARSANKKFQEAAAQRKQVEEFIKLAKSDPAKVLKELGVDIRQFTERQLQEYVQEELLSPEQRELRDAKARLARYEADEKQAQEAAEQAKLEADSQAAYAEYDTKFKQALESANLPRTPDTVRRMAIKQLAALNKGIDVTAEDLAGLVRLDLEEEHKTLLGALDEDKLEAYLTPELVKKLQKLSLKGAAPAPAPAPEVEPEVEEPKRKRDKLTANERKRRNNWGVMDHFGDN